MTRWLSRLIDRLALVGMAAICCLAAWSVLGPIAGLVAAAALLFAILKLPALPHAGQLAQAFDAPTRKQLSPGFQDKLDAVSARANLARTPRVLWNNGVPNAVSIRDGEGFVILVSECLHDLLSERQLLAVLAHEIAHIENGDIRIMRFAELLSRLTFAVAVLTLLAAAGTFIFQGIILADSWVYWCLAIAPTAMSGLQMLLSRRREYAADAAAGRLAADPAALGQALARIQFANELQLKNTIEEFAGLRSPSWMRTHPPVLDRIDRLQRRAADTA